MKKSIKVKLFIFIASIVTFFVVSSWIANKFFMDDFYIYRKKSILMDNCKMINSIYKGNPQNISFELEKLEYSTGINIIILRNDTIKYDSYFKNTINNLQTFRAYRPKLIRTVMSSDLKKDNNIVFKVSMDRKLKTNFLNLISTLNNGDTLILRTPLVAVEESVDIANGFFMFTGIITLIAGSILAYIFSRQFTKPILELNYMAKSMSNLDFTTKYISSSQDEIGELGLSINSLSLQLDKTITQLRLANVKLEKDLKEERKIDEMRKEFIASVSHDLKTPISLIGGYAEGLKLNINEDEKDFYCDVIIDEANIMNKLVKQLLELSQLQSGNLKLDKKDFYVSTLLNKVVSKFKTVFEDKGIKIIVEDYEDIKVSADAFRMDQILINYINNAINHIDDKKTIKISLKIQEEKVRVFVFNSGKHIPKEYLEQIWSSFYKVDKARTRAYGGTGLGLSIVKGIQNLHNSEYGVMNVDDGVTFWFDIDKTVNG